MALLTNTKAKHIQPCDKPLSHGGIVGLTLHPSAIKGRGKWVLRYMSPVTHKRRNAGLGSYPEVSIADVTIIASAMREQIIKGADPLELKKSIHEEPAIPTFEIAAHKLHAELLPSWKNEKHGKQWISTLEQYVFPTIGSTTLDIITPANIADALRPIWLTRSETASRIKQRIHAVMQWGWAHSYCSANPVDVVSHLLL